MMENILEFLQSLIGTARSVIIAEFPEEKVRLEGEIKRWREKLDSLEEPQ